MSKFSFLFLSSALVLSACTTVPKKGQPVQLANPAPYETPLPPIAQPVAMASTDLEARLAQLEQRLAATQSELAAMRPQVAKINVIEQQFKQLSLGLDRIDSQYGMAPAIAEQPAMRKDFPVPAPVKKAEAKKAAAKKTEDKKTEKTAAVKAAAIYDLRLGEQKGFTRLVLDAGKSVKLNYDLDNAEKILVIELPGFSWQAETARNFVLSDLIASYKAESTGSGTRLAILLKKPVKILRSESIAAGKTGYARSYLDIAPL